MYYPLVRKENVESCRSIASRVPLQTELAWQKNGNNLHRPKGAPSKGNLWSFYVERVDVEACLCRFRTQKWGFRHSLFVYFSKILCSMFPFPPFREEKRIRNSKHNLNMFIKFEVKFHMETAEKCILFLEVADRAIDHPLFPGNI